MHQLLHLTDSVRQLGPLYTFSCFDHKILMACLQICYIQTGIDKQVSYTFSCLQSMCALAEVEEVQMEYFLRYFRRLCHETCVLNSYDISVEAK